MEDGLPGAAKNTGDDACPLTTTATNATAYRRRASLPGMDPPSPRMKWGVYPEILMAILHQTDTATSP